MRGYPDEQFRDNIVRGIRYGFCIGFDRSQAAHLTSKPRNMVSVYQHAEVVESYLMNELQLGHILGPFERRAIPPVHVSGFGVIPKRHQPDKWRLIMNLSSPDGNSVNDKIDRAACSLSYVTVDDIARAALQLGRRALIAKTDIKHAYHQVPVHLEDRLSSLCAGRGRCSWTHTYRSGSVWHLCFSRRLPMHWSGSQVSVWRMARASSTL